MVALLYDMEMPEANGPREMDLATSRIAVLGARKCGKTWLCNRWCRGSLPLPDADDVDIGEDIFSRKILYPALANSNSCSEYSLLQLHMISNLLECEKQNEDCTKESQVPSETPKKDVTDVQVLDGADAMQADYSEVVALQIKQTDGFVLCIDVTNPESVENIELLHRQLCKLRGDKIPIVLCALKSDLEQDEKVVDLDQIVELCDDLQLDMDKSFFEVSALEDFGVQEVFYKVLRDIDLYKDWLRKERMLGTEEPSQSVSTPSTASLAKVSSISSFAKSSYLPSATKTIYKKSANDLALRSNSNPLAKLSETSSTELRTASEKDVNSERYLAGKARKAQSKQPSKSPNFTNTKDGKRKHSFPCGCVIC
ncbi:LAME_0D07866g1_1 [Lachancea meyersii CBS 8951]|uniref:LAME_0D07866g1_1 n=1 Tax=Lachancea meyersii CBS 8951 TaxID=1266667 RepID=A0A1G4JAM7_9SACH|nr:LAME_0D07866g1_1 [Lachancea meyersii CBS 8951]